MARQKQFDVLSRPVEPSTTATPEEQLLYLPVPQLELDEAKLMKVSFELVSPEQAREWLGHADSDESFRNRPTRLNDIRRWRLLMETRRFVNFLPDGPLLFDKDKTVLMNGKHRLSAVTGQTNDIGFMIVRRVPRWMMRFFDTGKSRTLKDMFDLSGRMSNSQSGSVLRLAMRYEEMIRGLRPQYGWREWRRHGDEHFDVDDYGLRREPLTDLYEAALQAHKGCRLQIASLMTFRFFQELAWPGDGQDTFLEFWDGLANGAMLETGHPALTLREWSRDMFNSKEPLQWKKEVHLLLLFLFFGIFAGGGKVKPNGVRWAPGMPMEFPYHPEGPDTAVKNTLEQLDAMEG